MILILLFIPLFLNAAFDIDGRTTPNLYRIDPMEGWTQEKISISSDTKKPIALLKKNQLTIEIHNFPGMQIAPKQQIDRWKKLWESTSFCDIAPQSFSGFRGLKIECPGKMGWALEIPQKGVKSDEKFSPVTIKVTGPSDILLEARDEILEIARSFELREPL